MILPDVLKPGLLLVIVGTAAGRTSAAHGHYYARPGNRFWRTLYEVGLTPTELRPADYKKLLDHGIGLTDLAKSNFGVDDDLLLGDFDCDGFRKSIAAVIPRFLVFNGKKAASIYFGRRTSKINCGRQSETFGDTQIYVCPQTSGANGHWSLVPWQDLARAVQSTDA